MTSPAEPSEITTHPPRAQITRELVQPPSRVYMTRDDQLYIRSRNSLTAVTLGIAGRVLTPNGEIVPFSFRHVPATDRTATLEVFQLAEGFLLSAVVFPSAGAPTRGQTFVELGLLRGIGAAADVVDVLAKDYVAENEPLGFPGSPIRSSLDGPGAVLTLSGTDPGAGGQISETVPTDARWLLIGVQFRFVTDVTVANRLVRVEIDDGTLTLLRSAATAVQVASLVGEYTATAFGVGQAVAALIFLIPLPPGILLGAGFRINTPLDNGQAGDNFSSPNLWVEEWIED